MEKNKKDSLQETVEKINFSEVLFKRICSIQPRCVMSNSSFIVDTSKLASASGIVADDCGSWKNNGQRVSFC